MKPIKRYNLSESSFLLILKLPEEVTPDFRELWELHPREKGKVLIYGKYRETPRWHTSYLQNYNFSGQTLSPTTSLPQSIKKILDFVNLSEEVKYNQVLVNWYLDGSHYIGSHSDDERQLVNNSNIFSLSLGSTRKFRMRDKKTREIVKDLNLSDGDIVVMGGTTQKEFKHEIVKIQGKKAPKVGKRINITFRKFTDLTTKVVDDEAVRILANEVMTHSNISTEVLSRIYRSFKKRKKS